MAAGILQEANSPIAPVCDELVAGTAESCLRWKASSTKRRAVRSDGSTASVLVGNQTLMRRYHITILDRGVRVKDRQLTYIAVADRLWRRCCCVICRPISRCPQLQRAEDSGLAFVVSTRPIPTSHRRDDRRELRAVLIARSRSCPPAMPSLIDEVTLKWVEEILPRLCRHLRQSRLHARAVGGCIGLKSNITLGIVIEIFGLVLGVLLCAIFSAVFIRRATFDRRADDLHPVLDSGNPSSPS